MKQGVKGMATKNTKRDDGKVIQRFEDGGYIKKYKDGTTERVRFTKTREVHDFDGPRGKASIWSRKNQW